MLSGVTDEGQAWQWEPSPDMIVDNLASVIRELKYLTMFDDQTPDLRS